MRRLFDEWVILMNWLGEYFMVTNEFYEREQHNLEPSYMVLTEEILTGYCESRTCEENGCRDCVLVKRMVGHNPFDRYDKPYDFDNELLCQALTDLT